MRPILSLAGWNWRMARRPYAILCAVFAAQQLAVLLVQAQDPDNTGRSLANLYRDGVQFLAFGLAFLLAGLLAGPASSDQKRARCSYTWLTLPLPPAGRAAPALQPVPDRPVPAAKGFLPPRHIPARPAPRPA